jgi:hypothetical protein
MEKRATKTKGAAALRGLKDEGRNEQHCEDGREAKGSPHWGA